jgi:hypothetical protein
MSIKTRYEVRQTLGRFGFHGTKICDTLEEAQKYGRDYAEAIAGVHYHHNKETGYADIPYRCRNSGNRDRGVAFAIKLSKLSGAYSDVDGRGRRFRVRGKMKWEDLVELIFQDVIQIREIQVPVAGFYTQLKAPINHECPHRFDNGFVPEITKDRSAIIVTRNSPLISVVTRKRPGEYRICFGSFIGGGGGEREASADGAAEYLGRSPHRAHLLRLTLELGWHDVHRALGRL